METRSGKQKGTGTESTSTPPHQGIGNVRKDPGAEHKEDLASNLVRSPIKNARIHDDFASKEDTWREKLSDQSGEDDSEKEEDVIREKDDVQEGGDYGKGKKNKKQEQHPSYPASFSKDLNITAQNRSLLPSVHEPASPYTVRTEQHSRKNTSNQFSDDEEELKFSTQNRSSSYSAPPTQATYRASLEEPHRRNTKSSQAPHGKEKPLDIGDHIHPRNAGPKPPPSGTGSSDRSASHWPLYLAITALAIVGYTIFITFPAKTNAINKSHILSNFQERVARLQSLHPDQSPRLWSRSKRILELHLNNTGHNSEPAIILLTAAQNAKQTLECVSKQLAGAYAASLNKTYTAVHGATFSSQGGDDAKLKIDNTLSSGFHGQTRAAVLHQIEMLPAGSLLILYKYCDHENAAFKDVALVLTVLLDEESLPPALSLKDLEEKVGDFLKDKFIGSGTSTSHGEMDVDKLSGVWSRISHVVLPVVSEQGNTGNCEEPKNEA